MKKLCLDCKYFKKEHKNSICLRNKKLAKGGKSKTCKLFKPKITIPIERCLPKPYRCIEQLHNALYTDERFKNREKEIWVIGCGPSLDDFPDDFFDDDKRIAIACKFAFVRFKNCTFNMSAYGDKSGTIRYIREENLFDQLKKFIITLRYEYKGDLHLFGKYEKDPYYMRVFKDRRARYLVQVVPRIMKGQPCNYPGVNTIIHFGIQAAAIMGARKIYLAGCEHHHHARRIHAQKGGMGDIYLKYRGQTKPDDLPRGFMWNEQDRLGTSPGWTEARAGTSGLAELLSNYGIEVVRYYHGIGEEKIEKIWRKLSPQIGKKFIKEGSEVGIDVVNPGREVDMEIQKWKDTHPQK